ncbi:hypothetical protein SAMN02745883_01385 [Caminicella sporogenes DSM 14501]|uniref:DUF5317 domain-containing protein n=1 Tax=Caminicella sporogenes DSM 14501 TaxID=1121266 RepID=A0A1M6Q4J1_9FIRM|nr:DUF5317 family protein [Caminicella sporogenes]RKD23568.1 hypothetical protein BET04_04005 [Caminicella sporogenes]SHK15028.1 hypothetical protein SAMN02745883_01385 [Caminicella sporogenes DSM 14501]
MFLEALLIGIIIGIVKKGRLSNLSYVRFRGWILIIFALFINILLIFQSKIPIINGYEHYLYTFGLVLIMAVLAMNLNKKGMWIILLGVFMNFVTVVVNGFKMPIYFEGLKVAGLNNMLYMIKSGYIANYIDLHEAVGWTKYISKFIVLPKPYPLAKVMSIGDLIMSLGIIRFLYGEMTRLNLSMRNRMINLGYKIKL